MLGILALDTAFPRIRGDLGCPETFDFPVKYATIAGADPHCVVNRASDAPLPLFVRAGRRLVDEGCIGIATTCGFLARWQDALARELRVPVMTSALLIIPLVASTLPARRTVGVVTYSAAALTAALLDAVAAPPDTPVEGIDPAGYFSQTIRHGAAELDRDRMAADVIEASHRLVARHRDVGAIVLECANMPPYRDAVVAATGLPVFDAAQVVAWFYRGIAGSLPRPPGHDLW